MFYGDFNRQKAILVFGGNRVQIRLIRQFYLAAELPVVYLHMQHPRRSMMPGHLRRHSLAGYDKLAAGRLHIHTIKRHAGDVNYDIITLIAGIYVNRRLPGFLAAVAELSISAAYDFINSAFDTVVQRMKAALFFSLTIMNHSIPPSRASEAFIEQTYYIFLNRRTQYDANKKASLNNPERPLNISGFPEIFK